jgi:peptidoglycan hydrolase-like protein with peptidoglycan-binding domain
MAADTFKIDNKTLWIGGGILLLAGLGTGAYFYFRKKEENKTGGGQSSSSGSSSPSGFCRYDDSFPLKHGSCGNKVTALQKILHVLGADLGNTGSKGDGVDGKYGDKTQAAVKKFMGKTTVSQADVERLKKK